jgi:hypothetical protein
LCNPFTERINLIYISTTRLVKLNSVKSLISFENMSGGAEPSYRQASGNSSESSYVLVQPFARECEQNPDAVDQNGSTLQPTDDIHTAAASTNQHQQQLNQPLTNDSQQAYRVNLAVYRCLIIGCQHPYHIQDSRTGDQIHVVPDMENTLQVGYSDDAQLWQQFSNLQIDTLESYGSSDQLSATIPVNSQTEQTPAWNFVTGAGTWASASTECLVGDFDMDAEQLGG